MPRTIDSTLQTKMAEKNFFPFAKITIEVDPPTFKTYECLEFNLTGTFLKAKYKTTSENQFGGYKFYITRGIIIQGIEYSLETSIFHTTLVHSEENEITTIEGGIFPSFQYINISGDSSYETTINNFCTAINKTYTLKYPTRTPWSQQFFETGKSLVLNNPMKFLSLLQQKYVVFACDNGNDEIRFFVGRDSPNATADHTISPITYKLGATFVTRNFTWKDENKAIHYASDSVPAAATYPLHNLGFIKSTETPPKININSSEVMITGNQNNFSCMLHPDLTILDGDIISFQNQNLIIQVEEIYNKSKNLPWRTNLKAIETFGNTEGGSIPNSIYTTSQYIPVHTSQFDKLLSTTDNNLQTALDTIDEKATPIVTGKTAAPTANDDSGDGYVVGHVWIDETNDDAYICLDNTSTAAVWKKMTP